MDALTQPVPMVKELKCFSWSSVTSLEGQHRPIGQNIYLDYRKVNGASEQNRGSFVLSSVLETFSSIESSKSCLAVSFPCNKCCVVCSRSKMCEMPNKTCSDMSKATLICWFGLDMALCGHRSVAFPTFSNHAPSTTSFGRNGPRTANPP